MKQIRVPANTQLLILIAEELALLLTAHIDNSEDIKEKITRYVEQTTTVTIPALLDLAIQENENE